MANGRTKWTCAKRTPAEKKYRRILAEHARGASLEKLAKEHGVKTSTLSWWKSQLRCRDRVRAQRFRAAKKSTAKLLPVRVEASRPPEPSDAGFEVLLRTARLVRVSRGFDGDELARLVGVLERSSC